jgi:hypothetical protein
MAFRRPWPQLCILILIATSNPARAADAATAGPLTALVSLYDAMEAGDPGGVRASFHTANDAERELADAYAAYLTAAKALGDAAKTKFAATGDALSKGLPVRDAKARLASAEVTVDGDTATVRFPDQPKPLRLVRSDGRWRVSIADYAGAATGENVAGQMAVIKDMTAVFNAVAADITADKYPTAPEAQRGLQSKLQAVLFNTLRKHPPTTGAVGPTTAPATTRPKP